LAASAEMLELIDQGVNNIVCASLLAAANHIVGKGMMKL
jgi:predicted nucleotide-binding protein (sugar kinase/HSP70/actin superfamily)